MLSDSATIESKNASLTCWKQAARRGEHTTMRQLMGYVAYLITGGTDSTGRLRSQKDDRYLYANLAFEGGEGPLFNLVQRAFDPARITHPVYDEELWRGTTNPMTGSIPPTSLLAQRVAPEEDRERCFKMAKAPLLLRTRRRSCVASGVAPRRGSLQSNLSPKALRGTHSWCVIWSLQ